MDDNKAAFDIIMETEDGLHLLMASSSNRQYAAIVAEALYDQSQEKKPGRSRAKSMIVRDMTDPATPRIMDVWPPYKKDHEAWQAALERAHKAFG